MKKWLFLMLPALLLLTGCGKAENTEKEPGYEMITPQKAKTIMETEQDYVILDVRTLPEYDMGHILGAILIDHEEIEEKAEEFLPDKDQLILVYCRSGRRSKIAAEALVKMGYTHVKEFGGIQDWPYEIEGIDETEG